MSTLKEGDTIYIKRTSGTLQKAVVSEIDYDSTCVKVEWIEDKDTKGKEIHFDNVTALNPGIVITSPRKTFVSNSRNNLIDEVTSTDRGTYRDSRRIQSARNGHSKSLLYSQNYHNSTGTASDQLKVEGKRLTSARTTRSVIDTVSKDYGTLKKVTKLEQDSIRLARRKRQAEVKAQKEEFLRKNSDNPHWKLLRMIEEFRNGIKFKPLSSYDPIEDHLITVAVRKRPLNEIENAKKEIDIITVPSQNQVIVHEPKQKVDLTKYLENHTFRFDYALNETCGNQLVYKYTAQPLIKTVFNGGFATCFAYGQTGSGKTYTMSGEPPSEPGIYFLTATDFFQTLHHPKHRRRDFTLTCSFFEIYVKKVFDLLNNKTPLKILEDGQQQVQIVGLTERVVTSPSQVMDLILQGNEERASGQTSANLQSSRSHAIFQFCLRTNQAVYGKFSLIDLAGNERGADTFSSSKTTRLEGSEINQSLLSLKECIRALGRKGAHLPFRGSKLTQVLRDSFVGSNSKTCMIAMISPGVGSCENTLNTLRYADRVKELGGGDIVVQKLEGQSELTNTCTKSVLTETVERREGLTSHNKDLIKVLSSYTKQAENLLQIKDTDQERYYINMNIVISDAISSLIKIRNLLNYFEVVLV